MLSLSQSQNDSGKLPIDAEASIVADLCFTLFDDKGRYLFVFDLMKHSLFDDSGELVPPFNKIPADDAVAVNPIKIMNRYIYSDRYQYRGVLENIAYACGSHQKSRPEILSRYSFLLFFEAERYRLMYRAGMEILGARQAKMFFGASQCVNISSQGMGVIEGYRTAFGNFQKDLTVFQRCLETLGKIKHVIKDNPLAELRFE